jgi:hypothetical protein
MCRKFEPYKDLIPKKREMSTKSNATVQDQQQEHLADMGFENIYRLKDRRTNPYIMTRRRKNVGRRNAYRAGLKLQSFISDNDQFISGSIKNISAGGACLELNNPIVKTGRAFKIGISNSFNNKIDCKLSWSKGVNGDKPLCGVQFVGMDAASTNRLRKSFLLNEVLLLSYAVELNAKTTDPETQKNIKTFFTRDLRNLVQSIIDIDTLRFEYTDETQLLIILQEVLYGALDKADVLAKSIPDIALVKQIKMRVRDILGHVIYQGWVFRRAIEKPRGYPGDYQVIEAAYNNEPLSGGLGRDFDYCGIAM